MRWFAVLPFLVLVVGCARLSVTTKVQPDGSFSRKIRYAVKKAGEGMAQTGAPQAIEDAFKLPAGAAPTKKTEADELTAEVEETVAAGSPALKDVVLLSDKKQPLVESSVTVRKLDNGNLEYVEHLHWVGTKPTNDFKIPPEIRALLKKSLPERLRKTEIIDGVLQDVVVSMMHAFFGPSRPIFFDLLTNQDAAEHQLIGQMVPELIKAMKTRVPDLTDDEALAVARALVAELKMTDFAKEKANAAQPGANQDSKNSDGNEITPMTFAVTFPGKILESNGIADPLSNEIYWSLYPASLAVGDVDLKVVAAP